MAVYRFGSCIKDYPAEAHPDQVHDDMIVSLKRAQNTDYLHITSFNRV